MSTDYRCLLELSARCEEKWLATEQIRYYNMARKYLEEAIRA